MPLRIVFLGSPAFAVVPLERLVADARYQVVGVVTQPDRPAGRGRASVATPVKQAALRLGVPVLTPETLRDPAAVANWQHCAPMLASLPRMAKSCGAMCSPSRRLATSISIRRFCRSTAVRRRLQARSSTVTPKPV